MGDYDDYPHEHDRMFEEDRGYDGGRSKPREDVIGREYRERERYDREPPPRDYDRRRDERDRFDRREDERDRHERRDDERDRYERRDDDRRRPPPRLDDRYDRGPGNYREQPERRDVRSDPREYGRDFARDYGRERRRSRSRDRRRSRSRERYDHRRDDREGGRRGRGGGGRGRRDGYSDDEEGFGGYRPRKRQQPPDPSKYDKPLPPGAGPGYISDPFYYLRQDVPSDPAEAQRLWLEQQLRSRQMVLQQQAASAAAASAKTQRELYIGNLVPGHVTDVALRQLFNSALGQAFPVTAGAEPVVNVNLHSDGRYAFVEFRTPEMATAALSINGQVQLLGQTISVGRPSGYVDPHKAAAAAQAAAQALAAFKAGDMAALAANATAAGMNLAQLGLANLVLPKPGGVAGADAAGGAAGAATAATSAAAPSREATPQPGAAAATAPAAPDGASNGEALQQEQVPQQQQQLQQGPEEPGAQADEEASAPGPGTEAANGSATEGSGAVTQFFSVHNMLTVEMLVDDEEYEAVIEDLRDECDRHAPGGVVSVKVPRPPQEVRTASEGFMGTGNYGKAFVAFCDTMAAQRAHAAIHGRLFAGSTVHVQYITEPDYAAV